MRMTCEEWFAQLRHSLARGAAKRRVGNTGKKVIVGSDNNRDLPARLVTVESFHRECVRVATELRSVMDATLEG